MLNFKWLDSNKLALNIKKLIQSSFFIHDKDHSMRMLP